MTSENTNYPDPIITLVDNSNATAVDVDISNINQMIDKMMLNRKGSCQKECQDNCSTECQNECQDNCSAECQEGCQCSCQNDNDSQNGDLPVNPFNNGLTNSMVDIKEQYQKISTETYDPTKCVCKNVFEPYDALIQQGTRKILEVSRTAEPNHELDDCKIWTIAKQDGSFITYISLVSNTDGTKYFSFNTINNCNVHKRSFIFEPNNETDIMQPTPAINSFADIESILLQRILRSPEDTDNSVNTETVD